MKVELITIWALCVLIAIQLARVEPASHSERPLDYTVPGAIP